MRFFFKKLRIDEKHYTQLLQDANMWHLIGGAFVTSVDIKYNDAKDRNGFSLMHFPVSKTYILNIDIEKIRKVFFNTDFPVKIEIKE